MPAQFFEKARKNRIIALRTVAARNAEPTPAGPGPVVGFASRRSARLALVAQPMTFDWTPDDRFAA